MQSTNCRSERLSLLPTVESLEGRTLWSASYLSALLPMPANSPALHIAKQAKPVKIINVQGTYTGTLKVGKQKTALSVVITQSQSGTLVATVTLQTTSIPVSGTISKQQVTLTANAGGISVSAVGNANKSGKTIKGTFTTAQGTTTIVGKFMVVRTAA